MEKGAIRTGILHVDLAPDETLTPMSQAPGGMSTIRGPIGRAGFVIDGSPAAGVHGLDGDAPFLGQVLEDPIEAAAIRFIAEGSAHVAAREAVGKAGQRRADVLFQVAGAAA